MRELPADLSGGLLDALDIGLIVLDADQRVVAWNDWLASASGRGAGQTRGLTLTEIFPDHPLRRLVSAVSEALTSGASSLLTHSLHRGSFPLTTRAGRPMVYDVMVRPVGAALGVGCLVQIVDVTAAANREQVLRERQNARYAAIVDNAPDAILTLDAEGVIQLASPAAVREFGFSAAELIGQPFRDFVQIPEVWDRAWTEVLEGHAPRGLDLLARRRDGSTTHLELSASRWDADGRIFVTAILRDVNARVAAEAALRRLNETLEERVATTLAERKVLADIVENTDAYIQILDPEFRFLAINRASANEFERVFGKRPRIGDSLLELLDHLPAERDNAVALWSRALAGEAFVLVHEFGDPGLDRRAYELKFDSLRDADGRQFAAYQFVYDVTDRIRREQQLAATEEALRQSQKMEAIGQLTGGIAHDFNNLLTGIIGSMDVLKRRIAAGRYEDTQRFMDAAVTSANRAAALTHRLLAFARRQPLDPRGLDANALVRGIEDLLRRTLGERIEFVTDLAQDLWPTLSDANQLENALLNLVINARDAMPDGGRLTISTSNVTLDRPLIQGQDQAEAGDYTVICVADTGVGIPPDVIDKVFDPFFTTKPIGQGTGLGLSMIYGFAKQSRGFVRVESEIGHGARISIYLPRYRGDLTADREEALLDMPSGSGERVLLVEDDSSVRLLIGEVLRELGYSCMEATDAQAALPMLASNVRIDLMITDVGLPGLNGRQLAELARQHRPDLKVLFVTGYAEHATDGSKFLEPGMAMVTKPFALDALALKIRDMLSPR